MAPRATGKSKNHKLKGEKKKREDKLLPTVIDIVVNLPSADEVVLKGISTDRILDVRKLLAVNVETCHRTRYSFSHQVRGDQLSDSQEIVHLKPCILTLVEETYTEEQAVDHVRRLLDIISCTTCFGPSGKSDTSTKTTQKDGEENVSVAFKETGKVTQKESAENVIKETGEVMRLCPPSELGKFYEFFSFSHLKTPIQGIKRLSRQGDSEDFFWLEVKVANGKLFTVAACGSGFYHVGKQHVMSHSLADLLRHLSKAFNDAYEDLLKAFSERNKFANIPYGLRANTWLVPPVAAESPSTFPSLPAEDEIWRGNGGGQGRQVESLNRPWSSQFSLVANMPCGTPEEREVRDHKAFVLHNYFVDVATTHAVSLVKELDARGVRTGEHMEIKGTLKFTVNRDALDPSRKSMWKIESGSASDSQESLSQQNLLKGITADESTVVHDLKTLGVLLVQHQGYNVVVEAVPCETHKQSEVLDIVDPPEGGANALNANSLRTLLHKKSSTLEATPDEVEQAKQVIIKVLEDGIANLATQKPVSHTEFIRWELGACWVQHLGENKENKKDSGITKDNIISEESPLKEVLSTSSLDRLRTSGTNLHRKTVSELMCEAEEYYTKVALPKLISDFAALELSPVEGRTLTDFMHIRGLRISSLGHLADLSAKLPHIRSLCIHEMIIRAFKHLLRAVVASVNETSDLALAICTTLNTIYNSLPNNKKKETSSIDRSVWKWLESFVLVRFGWKLAYDTRLNLRNYALLRGICYKVGIEMAPREYDFDSSTTFSKGDVISMVPIYKHAICSSADGRTLLESSKAALDKGKLDDAVSFGSKALTKLIAVCGPYHRMTAGAYSLLAVVLYHTGDFNQAMIYQQKALDINERELGLDHPDTMKSYGDLAVFYYRLQHTELALRYVNRALYLLHLICGPSHPNTAATYINVAMMEEALGNAHIALRYLHEALKCNERLLGKDHIQTAASYHAIAIALSLMEAYTLSVHHEQTTYQILQAKLGPDDIRTQDAAAWLEYFDSKAVEQQEAARTGAPKPDPSVASKGHLSVSDLLDFINAEVAASKEKEKRFKRLKSISSKPEQRSTTEEQAPVKTHEVEGAMSSSKEEHLPKQEVQPIKTVELQPIKTVEQQQQLPTEERPQLKQQTQQFTRDLSDKQPKELDEDEGWLEATSRGKHHRRIFQRFHSFTSSQASTSTARRQQPLNGLTNEQKQTTPKEEPIQHDVKKEEPMQHEVKKEEPTQEATKETQEATKEQQESPSSESSQKTGTMKKSYKDVALAPPPSQLRRIKNEVIKPEIKPEVKPEIKPEVPTAIANEADEEDANSQSSSTASSVTSHTVAVTPVKGSTQGRTTVAVTPIRKQVQTPPPSNPQDVQDSIIAATRGSDAADSLLPKKRMNPHAMEFVPGRKWHPFVETTNSLQRTGEAAAAQEQEQEQGLTTPKETHTGVESTTHGVEGGPSCTTEADSRLSPNTVEDGQSESIMHKIESGTEGHLHMQEPEEGEPQLILVHAEEDNEENRKKLNITTSDYYSSSSDCAHTEANRQSRPVLSHASSNFSRSQQQRRLNKARWQRRSDGAITRVYRLQGDKSSANPQLRTTSTFNDVPEPHTLQQSVNVSMRRSVQVS